MLTSQLTPDEMRREIAKYPVSISMPLEKIAPEDLEILLDCVWKMAQRKDAPAEKTAGALQK